MSSIITLLLTLRAIMLMPVSYAGFDFTQKASVFESGDGMYTVMWATNMPGTGYVTYSYGGSEYTVNDQTGGNINTTERIHSVRIPKSHLDNNTYAYHSQYVAMKFGYTAVKGKIISAEPVAFRGYNGQNEVNALVLSDIHGNFAPVKKAIDCFDKKADLLVLNGDISSSLVYERDFTSTVLGYAHSLSSGEIPVVYTRGNHETRGAYAAKVPSFFKMSPGGMYFTFRYGPLWSVVLDTGEDKADDHAEYSGLVDYTKYIADETLWLKGLELDGNKGIYYRVAFAHQPDVTNRYGNNWTGDIDRLGTSALISGHTHTFDLSPSYNEGAPFFTILEGGKSDSIGYIATMLTFSGISGMHVSAFNDSGESIAEQDFKLK